MTAKPANPLPSAQAALYCVDMGTTRTRVWLVEGEQVWARADEDFGVRDCARGQSREWLAARLAKLVELVGRQAAAAGFTGAPGAIAAAGMITSPHGLEDLPHRPAPAGAAELARHLHTIRFPGAGGIPMTVSTAIPMFLVPGIRTGGHAADAAGALKGDILRGEEALCIGLLAMGQLRPASALLNLGSHWKWVWIDRQSRIAGSRTSLTGELIHAAQTQTLIASALPQARPGALDRHWLHLGSAEAKRSGLTRTLFGVRLLEQASQGTAEERLAFLYGAFLEAEVEALARSRLLKGKDGILIAGPGALAEAWRERLTALGKHAEILEEDAQERAYLAGLRTLLKLARTAGGEATG